MGEGQREEKKKQIETIFNLVEQFKDSYYQEKQEKLKMESSELESEIKEEIKPISHPIITSEFKPLEKHVNIIVNFSRDDDSVLANSSKYDSG